MMLSCAEEMVQCSDGAEGGGMERESKKAKRDMDEMTKEKSQEWADSSIVALLDIYEEKWNYLKRGNLRSRDWTDLAVQVSTRCHGPKAAKTASQCKNKIESMKKKYRAEKQSKVTTGTAPRWKYYARLDSMLCGASPPKMLNVSAPPDVSRQPAVIDLDSREGLAQVESGDSGAPERPMHMLMAPCLTNVTRSTAVHNASCSLVTAAKSSAHEPAPSSVTLLVSREPGLQPLEEAVTFCTDHEFQEFLENEDSCMFDETNKKVARFTILRNNRRYRLEKKPGKVITLRSPSISPPTFVRVKLRNTKEFDAFLRSMGFIGLLRFPCNKDFENLILRYSELVDGCVCIGYKPGRLHPGDDLQDIEDIRISERIPQQ